MDPALTSKPSTFVIDADLGARQKTKPLLVNQYLGVTRFSPGKVPHHPLMLADANPCPGRVAQWENLILGEF